MENVSLTAPNCAHQAPVGASMLCGCRLPAAFSLWLRGFSP